MARPTLLALFAALIPLCTLFAGEELPCLTEAEQEEGFIPLFNGVDLEGWVGSTEQFSVEEGILVCPKRRGCRLYTENQYSNFVFRFEFKLEAGGNNGVGIRTPLDANAAFEGMEIQILDDSHPGYANLHDYQYHGSIYGVVPAERGHLNEVGQWNEEEIFCDGSHIKITLNGHVIVDADIAELSSEETLDGREHPGLENRTGHIGFLGHKHRVEFRNIRIKTLEE